MSEIRIEKKIFGTFVMAFALLCLVSVFSYRSTQKLMAAVGAEKHAHYILSLTARVLLTVTDVETGQRGFVITGDDAFLEPYEIGRGQIGDLLQKLRESTAANPRQGQSLEAMEALIAARLAWSEKVVALRRAQGFAAAQQETATHAGKKLHDAIREVISDMEKLELDALLRLEQDTLAEARFTLSLIVLFGVMAFFFVGTAWVVIHSDLLGRRRAEAVLQHAHDDLERQVAERTREMKREYDFSNTILASLPGVFYLYDENLKFMRWNDNFERVTGYTHDEISSMSPIDFFAGSDRELLSQRIQEVFSKGGSEVEADLVSKDGTRTPYFFTGLLTRFEDKTCLLGIGIDISSRRKAEDALRQAHVQLEQRIVERTAELAMAKDRAESADRLKSAFLATMSHELRTPLNSIIGFTGIILQGLAGPLNTEQSKQLTMVKNSASHLLALINDVLDISKIEAGQLEIACNAFDIRASLEKAVASVMPLAKKKGLSIDARYSEELAEVVSDQRRVEQIVINLLNNAIKFTQQGGVTLSAELVSDAPSGSFVRIRVKDSGLGITPEDLDTLFQPFRQIDTGLARQHEGTGMGLAICRRLADLLGAQIHVESEWGKGSVFTVMLPREGARQ